MDMMAMCFHVKFPLEKIYIKLFIVKTTLPLTSKKKEKRKKKPENKIQKKERETSLHVATCHVGASISHTTWGQRFLNFNSSTLV